eukprot:14000519-Alexandrium_andersonii.AAC.1
MSAAASNAGRGSIPAAFIAPSTTGQAEHVLVVLDLAGTQRARSRALTASRSRPKATSGRPKQNASLSVLFALLQLSVMSADGAQINYTADALT